MIRKDPLEIQQLYEYARKLPAFTPKMFTQIIRKLNYDTTHYSIMALINLWMSQANLKRIVRGIYAWEDEMEKYEKLIKEDPSYKLLYDYFRIYYQRHPTVKNKEYLHHEFSLANVMLKDAYKVFKDIIAQNAQAEQS